MTTPTTVTLPDDSTNTGKLVDNTQVANEAAVNVQRQAVSIGDPVNGSNRQTVNASGGASVTTIPLSSSQMTSFVINSSSSGDLPIVALQAGQTVRLHRLILFVGGATNITFKDGTTALTGAIPLQQNGSIILDYSGDPWFKSSAGNTLNINSSNPVQLSGTAYYVQN